MRIYRKIKFRLLLWMAGLLSRRLESVYGVKPPKEYVHQYCDHRCVDCDALLSEGEHMFCSSCEQAMAD